MWNLKKKTQTQNKLKKKKVHRYRQQIGGKM